MDKLSDQDRALVDSSGLASWMTKKLNGIAAILFDVRTPFRQWNIGNLLGLIQESDGWRGSLSFACLAASCERSTPHRHVIVCREILLDAFSVVIGECEGRLIYGNELAAYY